MSIEKERAAYDRRQRAWVYLVLGALVAWAGAAGFAAESTLWTVIGAIAFCAGLAAVTFGLVLFQKPRP